MPTDIADIIHTTASFHMRFTDTSEVTDSTEYTMTDNQAIHLYIRRYTGDDSFLNSIKSRLPFNPVLSTRQRRVVVCKMLNSFRAYFQKINGYITIENGLYTVHEGVTDTGKTPSLMSSRPGAMVGRAADLMSIAGSGVGGARPASDPGKPEPPDIAGPPLQAGIYTIEFLYDDHLTLQVKPVKDKTDIAMCVSYLYGPDNTSEYVGFAWIRPNGDVKLWKAFVQNNRLYKGVCHLLAGDNTLTAAHCNRCGRLLTVPTSLHSGYGPECIKHVGG